MSNVRAVTRLLRGQRSAIALIGISRVACGSLFGTAVAVYIGRRGSPFAVSLAYAAFSFGLFAFAPVWGAVADITGRRRAILVGTAVLSTLAVVPLTVRVSVPLEILCRGLFAVFTAGFQSVILTIVSETGGETGRGRSVGFYSSARSTGAISGRLFVGYLVGVLVPTGLYLLVVVLGLVAAVCTLRIRDPTPSSGATLTPRRLLSEVRGRLVPTGAKRTLFRRTGLGWLYVGIVLRNMTEKGFIAVVPVFLVSDVGLSNVAMGAVLAVSPAVRMVSMYGFGRLSDAVGRKKLIVGGLAGSGVQALVVVLALVPEGNLLRIGVSSAAFVVHAVTFSMLTVGTIAFVGDVAPVDRESELMGLRSTARGLGGVLGPLVVGVLATRFDYATAFVCISLLAFVAAGLVARTLVETISGR
ncbi:MFS transporter [Halogeometricum sp. S1BR25-6]|uniref:MFS transporter n=1 Tax=Halogeometricum salsisoli TaxID=2950536 RepID=A0ABU2GIH3_9EURY|nr:MFS transporter [Halogeometricum sp. S1BR25-6]MDS0300590.1 MFS transporter [Halogeometricum sp. S1BR25-6]